MKVFLTGGTGFIGQPLTQALLRRGWQVTALVRKPDSPQARALAKMGATLTPGDITDRESMWAGMTGAELVVHNAGAYEYGVNKSGRKLMHAINVSGTDNTLSLALELGAARVVYVSSTLAMGSTGPQLRDETFKRENPYVTYYEQTKAEAHELAKAYQQRGLPLVIVCPNAVIGPNDHSVWGYFTRLYVNGWMPPFAWSPDVLISLVHVEDLAEGIALAAEKGRIGETYLLAGEPFSKRQVTEVWATKPGGLKTRFWLPPWLMSLMLAPMEPLQRMAGLPAFLSRETVQAGSLMLNYSGQKARQELGWRYRPAREIWLEILDREIELRAARKGPNPVSRLRPVEFES